MLHHLPSKLSYTIVNGDIIDGENPRELGRYVSLRSPYDQARAAKELLFPIRERSTSFFLVKGSPYHEGPAAEAVNWLAESLDATQWANGLRTGTRLWLKMREAGGLILNASHHATRGWIYPAAGADRLALLATAAEAEGKLPHADLIVRSHLHLRRVAYAAGKHVILTPAWKLVTPFAERTMEEIRAEWLSDLGAVLVEVTPDRQVHIDATTFNFTNLFPRITEA